MLEKKPFVNYTLEEDKKFKPVPPLAIKLNDKDEEMIQIGRYAFNMESKGGVLKRLAEMGLQVILNQIGVENLHQLTNPRRRVLVQESPKYKHFEDKISKR